MRLHELSVTAFGPFVDTVHVDFDELAASGLFLLTGDTGAGKTSVLDAVCFALYGEVPGERHSARHLRSDQADPHTEPRVVLRVSIGERTLRLTRSPAWERPKRRGTGSTRVQAHVVVEELREQEWVALTNRLDEAGHLVSDLLGMTCTQFTQVAMLPQGRFQAFLRASSGERHAVLQRLFRTRRFEDVERWLADQRLDLRRQCQTHHDVSAGIVNRLQEAASAPLPDDWDVHDLDPVAHDGTLETWAAGLLAGAESMRDQRRTALETATAAVRRDSDALDRARVLLDARARGERARDQLALLDDSAEEEQSLVTSLDAHRRAAPVLPLALRVESAADQHVEAQERATGRLQDVAHLIDLHVDLPADQVDVETLAHAATRLHEERAVAEAWLPREQQLQAERDRLRELSLESARLATSVTEREQHAAELERARGRAASSLTSAQGLAARVASDAAALAAAEQGLQAATEAAEVSAELVDARARLDAATSHAQDLREVHLDLRERRISGMAAELAGGLAVGCSCPVCGSLDHPSPASVAETVSRADEDSARERQEAAAFEQQALREAVATLTTRLEAARTRSEDRSTEHWRAALATAAAAATDSEAAVEDAAALRTRLEELIEEERSVHAELATTRVTLAERSRAQAETTERRDRLAAELDGLLSDHPEVTTVAGLVDTHRRAAAALEEARAALVARDRAAEERHQASLGADAGAQEAGFASVSEALRAVLPGAEAVRRSGRLEERRGTRAAAEAVLAEQSVLTALTESAPDLDVLTARHDRSTQVRDEQHAAHEQTQVRVQRLESLTQELRLALAAWAPVRERHVLAAALASLVEGKSAENRWKMRLSAYVLSERLRQVVAAANERLGAMTDQRYLLEQADEKGAGEQRGGLSLRVRDEWSGKDRDPATLSGGETFLVSLALALGLADTVSHEAGGTQLDTLFIDEGFGALDATTLDGVMDTLDSLRDGGRVVGLVSHVAELRNRVPAQLEVRKARHGSTLWASVADA